jgi:hypothetical protein
MCMPVSPSARRLDDKSERRIKITTNRTSAMEGTKFILPFIFGNIRKIYHALR